MEEDDSRPLKGPVKPRDLDDLSIADLEEYIAGLEAEIARARQDIVRKDRHREGVEGLFKRGR